MYVLNLHSDIDNALGYLNIMADKAEEITIKILSSQGGFVHSLTSFVEEGAQQLVINLKDLASGKYIVNAFGAKRGFLQSFSFTI